jgi:hypothetical protein
LLHLQEVVKDLNSVEQALRPTVLHFGLLFELHEELHNRMGVLEQNGFDLIFEEVREMAFFGRDHVVEMQQQVLLDDKWAFLSC